MKKFAIFLLTIFSFFMLTGCINKISLPQKNEYPVTIQDVKFTQCPCNTIVLSDCIADIILAENYEINIKAKSSNCSQTELSSLEDVGSLDNIDIDKIKSIKPDVVLADENTPGNVISLLYNNNIKTVVFNNAKIRSEIENLYIQIGTMFGGNVSGNKKALKTVTNIFFILDDIDRAIPTTYAHHTACYMFDDTGKIVTGNDYPASLLTLAGAFNIASGETDNKIDIDKIKFSNPDFIFCDIGVKEKILANDTFKDLNAVKNGNIFEMDKYMMYRQGKTMIDATTFMAGIMYPELTKSSSDISSNENNSSNENSSNTQLNITDDMTIPYGEQSDNVELLENRLDELNYMPTPPSGTFNDNTVRAVTDFQYLNGLEATGVADAQTIRLIFSDSAVKRSDPAREK